MKNALIGTGFYAPSSIMAWNDAHEFLINEWGQRDFSDRDVVIVNNSFRDLMPYLRNKQQLNWREVFIQNNLGHIGGHMGKNRPHLLGWSMSWIIPATVAYSEQRDFLYVEQDCILHGDCEGAILEEAKANGWAACFGPPHDAAACEQSLFWIRADYITEFIWRYLGIPEGDGVKFPEAKFMQMKARDSRIGLFHLPGGRIRPIPTDSACWYAQQVTDTEMKYLKESGLR